MQGQCGVDVGFMGDRQEVDVFVDGKIYRINQEVEVEVKEGNKKCKGGNKNIKEENDKIVEKGIRKN